MDLEIMKNMKKLFFSLILLAFSSMLLGQQQHKPMLFRNHQEYLQYQLEHPDRMPLQWKGDCRAYTGFSQKLDSVIGSDDFDRSRWKNEYDYELITDENGDTHYSDKNRTETSYVWEAQSWKLASKTVIVTEGLDEITTIALWDGEKWENSTRTVYHYEVINGETLLDNWVRENYVDSVWTGFYRFAFEYNSLNDVTQIMVYTKDEDETEWVENSKYEMQYNDQGSLEIEKYYTVRNGNWRENSMDSLKYDDDNQCVEMLSYMKGGYGPMANQWRLSSKCEFTYKDDQLESETYYEAGWFGIQLSLENRTEYQFDDAGNLVMKTANVDNGVDWVARDTYVNTYDLTVDAASVLGLVPIWETTVENGMANVLELDMPVNNKWCSCNIASLNLDTQFDLYYSGFAAVEEHLSPSIKVYASAETLVVENDLPSDIVVYDLLGRVVASEKNTLQASFSLNPGIYVVANGNSTVKAVVW